MSIGDPIPIKARPHSGLELSHPLSIMAVSPLCSGPNGNHEEPLPSLTDAFLPLPCSMVGKSQHQLEHPEKLGDTGCKWDKDLVLRMMGKQEHIFWLRGLNQQPPESTSSPLETKTHFTEMPGYPQTAISLSGTHFSPGLRHILCGRNSNCFEESSSD